MTNILLPFMMTSAPYAYGQTPQERTHCRTDARLNRPIKDINAIKRECTCAAVCGFQAEMGTVPTRTGKMAVCATCEAVEQGTISVPL